MKERPDEISNLKVQNWGLISVFISTLSPISEILITQVTCWVRLLGFSTRMFRQIVLSGHDLPLCFRCLCVYVFILYLSVDYRLALPSVQVFLVNNKEKKTSSAGYVLKSLLTFQGKLLSFRVYKISSSNH